MLKYSRLTNVQIEEKKNKVYCDKRKEIDKLTCIVKFFTYGFNEPSNLETPFVLILSQLLTDVSWQIYKVIRATLTQRFLSTKF